VGARRAFRERFMTVALENFDRGYEIVLEKLVPYERVTYVLRLTCPPSAAQSALDKRAFVGCFGR
jgi:hypothetical protein